MKCDIVYLGIRYCIGFSVYDIVLVNLRYHIIFRMHTMLDLRCRTLDRQYRTGFSVYDIMVVNLRYVMHKTSYVGPKMSYFEHTIYDIVYDFLYILYPMSALRYRSSESTIS